MKSVGSLELTCLILVTIGCLAGILVAGLFEDVDASTIVVPTDYSGIGQAVNAAQPGDTILVNAGTYMEEVDVDKPLTIIGNGSTVLSGGFYGSNGFYVTSDNVNISRFHVSTHSEKGSGVELLGSHCRIEDIRADGFLYGIRLSGANDNYIANCTLKANIESGLAIVEGSENNTLFDVNCNYNDGHGLLMEGASTGNNFDWCFFTSSGDMGVVISGGSGNNTFTNTTIDSNTDIGLHIRDSHHLLFVKCSISKTLGPYRDFNGVDIYNCSYSRFTSCRIDGNTESGISGQGDGLIVEGCTLSDNKACGIEIYNSNGVTIANNTVSGSISAGIALTWSAESLLINNSCSGNEHGLQLFGLSDCEVAWNLASDNRGAGIYLGISGYYGLANWLHNNTILRNGFTYEGSYGGILLVYTNLSLIDNNTLEGNRKGIVIDSSWADNNIFRGNLVKTCTVCAIEYVTGGGNNTFHHNNFIDNAVQVARSSAYDMYDDGSEGNYWGDYTSRYPDAHAVGRVWDTPYDVSSVPPVQDRYPLALLVDYSPPRAEAGPDVTVDQNTTVAFDGRASWDNIGIVDHTWSFTYMGEPQVLQGAVTEFTFDMPGNYSVVLTVRDAWGNAADDGLNVTVIDTMPPHADAGGDITVDMGEAFTMNGSASWDYVGIVNYTWVVDPSGLNLTLSGVVVDGVIQVPGDFKAELTVTDLAGNANTTTIMVHVMDTVPPVANAGPDMTVDQGSTVMFNGTASSNNVGIVEWNWSFMYDGLTVALEGESPSFLFDIPGFYQVTLSVVDRHGLSALDLLVVTVRDTVAPVARPGQDIIVDQGAQVAFDGSASSDNVGIETYEWRFVYDGSSRVLQGERTDFTFEMPGIYEVVLRVADAAGNTAESSLRVTVNDTRPPLANAGADLQVDQGASVTLDGTGSSDNAGISNYTWEFMYSGSPVVLHGPSTEFVFSLPGLYTVKLTVMDAAGNTASDEVQVSVRDTVPPQATACVDVTVVEGTTVALDGSASTDNVGIAGYEWAFTYDNATKAIQGRMASFLFGIPGVYYVTLKVTDAAGNLGTDDVTVTVLPRVVGWTLGPLLDKEGKTVAGMEVSVTLNGTTYKATSGEDGIVRLRVSRYDRVSPAKVTVTKEGWKSKTFDVPLDDNGAPVGALPAMEKRPRKGTPSPSAALASLALCAVAVLAASRSRAGGRGGAGLSGRPSP